MGRRRFGVNSTPHYESCARSSNCWSVRTFDAKDKALSELQFPRSATVVAIVRDERVMVPDKATVLRVGDEVMALISEDAEAAVQKILVG